MVGQRFIVPWGTSGTGLPRKVGGHRKTGGVTDVRPPGRYQGLTGLDRDDGSLRGRVPLPEGGDAESADLQEGHLEEVELRGKALTAVRAEEPLDLEAEGPW